MDKPRIQVVVRKRPLTSGELRKNHSDVIDVTGPQTLVVKESK